MIDEGIPTRYHGTHTAITKTTTDKLFNVVQQMRKEKDCHIHV